MIKKGETFEVYDSTGRYWGSVCFQWPYKENISGNLVPSPEFEEVRSIFNQHEEQLCNPTDDELFDETAKIITNFGVVLVNKDTGEKKTTDIVFVSTEMVFTCGSDI